MDPLCSHQRPEGKNMGNSEYVDRIPGASAYAEGFLKAADEHEPFQIPVSGR